MIECNDSERNELLNNKKGANIDVLVGSGEQPMWNIRR